MTTVTALPCPLCLSSQTEFYHQDKRRHYYQCGECALVFVEPAARLELDEEKAAYDNHENDIHDEGYRTFLSRMSAPILDEFKDKPDVCGLDFGCGPGPALADIFSTNGIQMNIFDPIYANTPDVLSQQYDFVTCTEAIEHFYYPNQEWETLKSLIKPKGVLGIMTKLVIDKEAFGRWHYKNDITHVCFFSRQTFEFLAERDNLSVDFIGSDVILFKKQA